MARCSSEEAYQLAIERAMACKNDEKRDWLYAGRADSYGERSNRAECWVLEGSPPRGFIIATAYGLVIRMDDKGKVLRRFYEHQFREL